MSSNPRQSLNPGKQLQSPAGSTTKIQSISDIRQKTLIGQPKKPDSRKQSLSHLGTLGENQSGLTTKQQEELQNLINISQKDLYKNKDWNYYFEINNSESIAIDLVEQIIDKGADTLYDNYLNQKQYKHVFESIMYLSELSWQQERLIHDLDFDMKKQKHYFNFTPEHYLYKYKEQINEDIEPEPPGRENRRNYNVEVEKKVVIDQEDSIDQARNEIIDQLMNNSGLSLKKHKKDKKKKKLVSVSNMSQNQQGSNNESVQSSRQSSPHHSQLFQSVKDVQSITMEEDELKERGLDREAQILESYNQPNFTKHNAQIISIHQPQEIDRVEEQLRLLKEREIELKLQKAEFEALRLQEQKEQQLRLKNMKKGDDKKQKLLAYDFNGQVFGMVPTQVDKFPQSTIVLQHQVTKAETSIIDYSLTSKEKQKAQKRKQKQQQDHDDGLSVDMHSHQQTPTAKDLKRKSIEQTQLLQKQQTQPKNQVISKVKEGGGSTFRDQMFFNNQEVFDVFKVNKGVTLIENGKIKKGPNFVTGANSVDLSRMVEKDYGKNLKISKNSYNQLFGGGVDNSLLSNQDVNLTSLSRANSIHSASQQNIRFKTESSNNMILPLNLLSQGITPKNILFQKKNMSNAQTPQPQSNLSKLQKLNNNIFTDSIDQNLSSSHLGPNSPNKNNDSSQNLNLSNISKKKKYFSSQKKLVPIDPNKISVQSMEILQTLALDDHDYVLKVLNQNPADSKRSNHIAYDEKYINNKTQDKKKSQIQEYSDRSILNEASVNHSHKKNVNKSKLSSINNMSAISSSSKKPHSKSQIIPITRPTDEYNRAIITGGIEWGVSNYEPHRQNNDANEIFKANDEYKQKHILGYHGKFPKGRIMKKTLDEMSHTHLSPPEIGSTMGYGAGNGYNPNKLISVKQFIVEQQNEISSQQNLSYLKKA